LSLPVEAVDGTEIPPTGRQASAGYATFTTVPGERAVRTFFYFDQLDLLEQLGPATWRQAR
jgi:hypothetical protein